MITGIGVDIVHVQRMERWIGKRRLLERFFHGDELAASFSRGGFAAPSLAARFAAKEAFGKALGTGLAGLALKDIVVKNRYNGKPEIHAQGTALSALQKNGADRVHLSLTHEQDNAVAMVVLESAQGAAQEKGAAIHG
jgi:holo-[acyl-carrier protein] synthase